MRLAARDMFFEVNFTIEGLVTIGNLGYRLPFSRVYGDLTAG